MTPKPPTPPPSGVGTFLNLGFFCRIYQVNLCRSLSQGQYKMILRLIARVYATMCLLVNFQKNNNTMDPIMVICSFILLYTLQTIPLLVISSSSPSSFFYLPFLCPIASLLLFASLKLCPVAMPPCYVTYYHPFPEYINILYGSEVDSQLWTKSLKRK